MTSLLNGIILGLSIAAPVGPIGILCIRTTLVRGRLYGIISGLGAATADAIYGVIAATGLTIVSQFLVNHSLWINLIGAFFLLVLAYNTIKISPVTDVNHDSHHKFKNNNYYKTFSTTLFLTLTNPLTIMLFAGIFAGMNTSLQVEASIILVVGVFLGSLLWWLILSFFVGYTRKLLNRRAMRLINILSGLILIGFGLASLYKVYTGLI